MHLKSKTPTQLITYEIIDGVRELFTNQSMNDIVDVRLRTLSIFNQRCYLMHKECTRLIVAGTEKCLYYKHEKFYNHACLSRVTQTVRSNSVQSIHHTVDDNTISTDFLLDNLSLRIALRFSLYSTITTHNSGGLSNWGLKNEFSLYYLCNEPLKHIQYDHRSFPHLTKFVLTHLA